MTSVYECNEQQFIENISRLLRSGVGKMIVNRRITLYDDHRYGLSILPEEEFVKYSSICERKGIKKSVYAKVPFVDEFHDRFYDAKSVLHSSSNLASPRLSIPYYRVEHSFSLWGNSYVYSFDLLFEPSIRIGKRSIHNKQMLVHILSFNQPNERMFEINIPEEVIVLDVKKMQRSVDSY
jgi:hypothetical protein